MRIERTPRIMEPAGMSQRATRRLVIRGGRPAKGTLALSGAKNAALPLMVAGLLADGELRLTNVPRVSDTRSMASLLASLGVAVRWKAAGDGQGGGASATLSGRQAVPAPLDAALAGGMRASMLLLGALLARCGRATLPLPGGDAIGPRPIDFHIDGLLRMTAEIDEVGGTVVARAPRGLRGGLIVLPFPSVGATENLMLAASLARGETEIRNAAREPEIADLAACLNAMGACIEGAGGPTIRIQGVTALDGASHRVPADRIEAGTFACLAAATGGRLLLKDGRREHLGAAAATFEAAGVLLEHHADGLVASRAPGGLRAADLATAPYPGFATDLQPAAMAMLALAEGASIVDERIFEDRFRHVPALARMGADITIGGSCAMIRGVPRLCGIAAGATDIRAAAALVIAACAAHGTSELGGLAHLDRGHQDLEARLAACGVDIERI